MSTTMADLQKTLDQIIAYEQEFRQLCAKARIPERPKKADECAWCGLEIDNEEGFCDKDCQKAYQDAEADVLRSREEPTLGEDRE